MNALKSLRHNGISGRVCSILPTALTAFAVILAFAALAVMTACNRDDSQTPVPTDGYTLNLTISAANSLATRAALSDPGANEHTADAFAEENFININAGDYAVFIFDGEGKFVQRFEPGSVQLRKNPNGTVEYTLSGVFYADDDTFPADADGKKRIRIAVAANWMIKFGNSFIYNNVENDLKSKSLTDLYEAANLTFTLPTEPAETADATRKSWIPDGSTTGIPMFGVSGPVELAKVMNFDTVEGGVDNSIYMLRSLAKIEVYDAVPDGKSAEIDRCVLTGYNTVGRYVPDGSADKNPDWNEASIQVKTPTLPSGTVPTDTNLCFHKGQRDIKIGETTYTKDYFVVYVPEMDLTVGTRPVINVYLKGKSDPATIQLADYDGGKEPVANSAYTALLRNHSYRYNVKSVGIDATLWLYINSESTDVQWDTDNDSYVYEDLAVEFAPNDSADPSAGSYKTFEWNWTDKNKDSQETILGGKESNRRNVVVSIDSDFGAEATFTITEPARGTWALSLYSDDGTANHWFRIDTWDATTGEWIIGSDDASGTDAASGDIPAKGSTPTEVKIRIVANELQYTGSLLTARLAMNVTTFDGRMMEVNLTSSDPMNHPVDPEHPDYYMIVQYPTANQ